MYEWFLEMGGPPFMKDPKPIMVLLIVAASKQIGQLHPPINILTLEMLKPKKSSKPTKARLKAAEARRMIPVLEHIHETVLPPAWRRTQLRLDLLMMLDNFVYVVMAN